LFTQAGTGASPGYDAIDRRRSDGVGRQEGVMAATSCEVTQRGAGANMSVDIAMMAIDAESGVLALVKGDAVTGQGLYEVPAHTAVINEAITAAHATLPRVDRVILEVKDTTHDASGSNLVQTRVVAGTATSGATLDNLSGAAAVPDSALLLADVLVGAAVTSITNAVIRDRRKWARGALAQYLVPTTLSTTSSTLTEATAMRLRVECSGVPVRVTLSGYFNGADNKSGEWDLFINGSTATSLPRRGLAQGAAGGIADLLDISWVLTPGAGSKLFAPAYSSLDNATSIESTFYEFTVMEIVRQNTKNNATTTG